MNETDNINYADDFRYNEILHSTAQSIMHLYIRIRRENPGHANRKVWTERIDYWSEYDRDRIRNMTLDTQEKAKEELEKVLRAYKEAQNHFDSIEQSKHEKAN